MSEFILVYSEPCQFVMGDSSASDAIDKGKREGNMRQEQGGTAFRESQEDCLFCSRQVQPSIVYKNFSVFAIADNYPVTHGHVLIIPYRHTEDFFSMTTEERRHTEELLLELQAKIRQEDPTVTGFNIGINCGESAGQTIRHAHIHLIPRRDGDVENPRGGVRGCVPARMHC